LVIARHQVEEGHDTEIIPDGPSAALDHVWPSKTRVFPSRLTATQNSRVAHDTSRNRSLSPPVPGVCCVDHEWPSNVATVLDAPAVPLAPTAAQKVMVGHDTL
jgi:hypothetical protein